jgi:hypothetical protein
VRDEPNICRQIHLPAQSGSTRVLEAMRRGYSAESYVNLVHHIREIIPGNRGCLSGLANSSLRSSFWNLFAEWCTMADDLANLPENSYNLHMFTFF